MCSGGDALDGRLAPRDFRIASATLGDRGTGLLPPQKPDAPSTLPLREYVAGDVGRTTDEYGIRMQHNYSHFGDAAASDPLVAGDGQSCKEIFKELARR